MDRQYRKNKRPIDYVTRKYWKAIDQVWKYNNLDYIRDELDRWFSLGLSHDDSAYYDTKERAQFIEFYDELMYLIEAMYFFTSDTDAAELREQKLPPEDRGKENQAQILSEDSVADPLACIKDFCQRIPLRYVRIEMWDFFSSTGCYRGNLEITVDISRLFRLYLDVMVLLEAAYIITTNSRKHEKK